MWQLAVNIQPDNQHVIYNMYNHTYPCSSLLLMFCSLLSLSLTGVSAGWPVGRLSYMAYIWLCRSPIYLTWQCIWPCRSPIWRGGGHAHAKKPRDWSHKLNRKLCRMGLRVNAFYYLLCCLRLWLYICS